MPCTLCNLDMDKSGSLRPNIATYDCGHEYHLSCALLYSKENISMLCPSCHVPEKTLNLGDDRQIAMQSLIDARRTCLSTPTKGGIWSWFTDKSLHYLIKTGASLESLKLKGVTPEDLIEEQIKWESVSSIYKTGALLNFGFRWHHMITMGFQPEHFKLLDWHQMSSVLNLQAVDMLKTSITIRELAELKIDVAHLHQLGFRLKELKQIGGDCETLKLLTSNLSDIKTYFSPSPDDWEDLGFTKESIGKNNWMTEEFTPVRQPRKLHKNGFVF